MSATAPSANASFLELFGNRSFNEVFSNWEEVDVSAEGSGWAGFPPAEFLSFCASYPRMAFDGIPPAPHHRKPPTFLLSQAHRMWLTASRVQRQLAGSPRGTFLDVGSFPFVVPLVLRDYFGFEGRIVATRNLDLPAEGAAALAEKRVEAPLLDLDPFIRDPQSTPLPAVLDLPDGSVDVVLMAHVIEHLYHPMSALRECARVLRPGGRILITTDNAMMLDTLLNFVGNQGYLSEPVEGTAAMTFSFWRGHVRFFTRRDLEQLLGGVGLRTEAVDYDHVFYDVLLPEYFEPSTPRLNRCKYDILAAHPQFRNDITITGSKPAA